MHNTILALASGVPETRLQHQLGGWGSQAQVTPIMTWLIIGLIALVVLSVLKKLLAS